MPATAEQPGGHRTEERQLQAQVEHDRDDDGRDQRPGHVASRVLRLAGQLDDVAEPGVGEHHPGGRDRRQRRAPAVRGEPAVVGEVRGVEPRRDQQHDGRRRDQDLDGGDDRVRAGEQQDAEPVQGDEAGHEHDGDDDAETGQRRPVVDAGEIAGRVLHDAGGLGGRVADVADPHRPPDDARGQPAVGVHRVADEAARLRLGHPELGEHHRHQQHERPADDPGEQRGRPGVLGGVERGEQPPGADDAAESGGEQRPETECLVQARVGPLVRGVRARRGRRARVRHEVTSSRSFSCSDRSTTHTSGPDHPTVTDRLRVVIVEHGKCREPPDLRRGRAARAVGPARPAAAAGRTSPDAGWRAGG